MRRKNLLHFNHLDEFRIFLIGKKWGIQTPKGDYEVLRAKNLRTDKMLFVYDGIGRKEHFTTFDESTRMALKFYEERSNRS